jgi:hypothetical protein
MVPRFSMMDCTESEIWVPRSPGTLSRIRSWSSCCRPPLLASTNPATEMPSRISGNSARKLK